MKLNKQNIPFTQVANEVLCRKDLSLKAKGLYAYLFSKPENWDFAGDRITKEGSDGRRAVFNALKELERVGLLERKRQDDGKMAYLLKHSSEPVDGFSKVPKAQSAETGSISNIDKESNKDKDTSHSDVGDLGDLEKKVGEVINLFKNVNPSYKTLFMRKPQRDAVKRLGAMDGFEKLMAIVSYLPKSNANKFAPTITTPIELERDLGRLIAWSRKQKDYSHKGREILV